MLVKFRYAIALALCALLYGSAMADIEVTFFDVGNADACLIECDGAYMLVDAGTNRTAAALLAELRDIGVDHLDWVVGTHPHEDHIGGLDDVLNAFSVSWLMMPDVIHNTATHARVMDAAAEHDIIRPQVGDTFSLGGASVTVLSPARDDYAEINMFSIVLRVDYGNFSLLLTGDAEDVNEFEMIDTGMPLRVTILSVGHHGSDTSNTAAFLGAVQPEVAVISCGADNPYGHPESGVMQRLEAVGCAIYRTDLMGNISIESDGNLWTIVTEID